jgi:hypothetical protein
VHLVAADDLCEDPICLEAHRGIVRPGGP